ncbi:MAG: hypothetical protein ABF876_09125 [Acetobacter aceti]|nr:hypothetical protein [Acetobacter aceti]
MAAAEPSEDRRKFRFDMLIVMMEEEPRIRVKHHCLLSRQELLK